MMVEKFPAHATVNLGFLISAERVFDVWLDVKMISRFMFGSEVRDEQIISLSVDTRAEGTFSFIVRRKGTIPAPGVYLGCASGSASRFLHCD